MHKTREQKKAETRKAILDAAVHLFVKNGFEGTSIDELARGAGIGKGTVYTYFKTKKDILRAFCENELAYIHSELAEKTNSDASFIDQLHTIFFAEFKFITRNREFGRILMQEQVFPREKWDNSIEKEEKGFFAMLFPIIEKAMNRGEVRKDIPPLYIAGHFYANFLLLVSSWYIGRFETAEETSDMLYLFFEQTLEGLRPKTNSP